MERKCIFAGQWYPVNYQQQKKYFSISTKQIEAKAIIVPHAGWIYSGKIAGITFGTINPADIFILIGPNHTGMGEAVAVFPEGKWLLPEKKYLTVDSDIAAKIIQHSQYAQPDALAHLQEHSLEVQMPFIYLLNSAARIIPITLGDYHPEIISDLSRAIISALKSITGSKNKIVLVASTDLSHYVPQTVAKKLDYLVIEAIKKMDPNNLLQIVAENNITMCGAGPVATVLEVVSSLYSDARAELIKYSTSAEASNDTSAVVGYAGMVIY